MSAPAGPASTQLTPFGARVRFYEGEPPVPYEILAPVRLRVGSAGHAAGSSRAEAERRLRERVADLGGNAVVRSRWRSGWRAHPWAWVSWALTAPLRFLVRGDAREFEAHAVEGLAVRLLPVRLRAPRPTVAAPGRAGSRTPGHEPTLDLLRIELYAGEPPHPYRIVGPVHARAGPSLASGQPSLAEAERRLRERAAQAKATAVIHVEARFGFRARPWATFRHAATQWMQFLAGRAPPPDFAVKLAGVAVEVYPFVPKPRAPTSSARSTR